MIGVLSFNLPADQIRPLYTILPGRYGLQLIPALTIDQTTPTFLLSEVLAQMVRKMALGDTFQSLYIEHFAPQATCLLSWNARHFQQKVSVPVLTPEEWLTQNIL